MRHRPAIIGFRLVLVSANNALHYYRTSRAIAGFRSRGLSEYIST